MKAAGTADGPLARYARILEVVGAAPGGLTLGTIGDVAGLRPATAHRLVGALCAIGFLARQDRARLYVPGPRLVQLCRTIAAAPSVVALARPLLCDLVGAFGETAYLAELRGSDIESVAMEMPDAREKSLVQPGRAMPWHASASGKAIAAFQSQDFIDRKLAEPRERFTADTKVVARDIESELAKVQAQGYAICANELDPGVLGVAVPVLIEGLGVTFAIGLLGLSARLGKFPLGTILAGLHGASAALTRRLKAAADAALPVASRLPAITDPGV